MRALSTQARALVFETRTATGSELLSLLTCLHKTTFTLLSIFSPLEIIVIKIGEKPLSWNAKCSLPVAVRLPSAATSGKLSSFQLKVLTVLLQNKHQFLGTSVQITEGIQVFSQVAVPYFCGLTLSMLFSENSWPLCHAFKVGDDCGKTELLLKGVGDRQVPI